MSNAQKTIGLVGARGYVGRELIDLIARSAGLSLGFAVSRDPSAMLPGVTLEALGPEEVAERRADAVVLALPNGKCAPFVEAIDRLAPETVIVDLSGDHRFDDAWTYGLPEINRAEIAASRRIANPGCYATSMMLALWPLRERLEGTPSCFGISGYSGAGSKPNPRNDRAHLATNLLPYALAGHQHEHEVSRHLGHRVRFSPHVAEFFRGISMTVHARLAEPITEAELRALYDDAWGAEPLITLTDEPPEVAATRGKHGGAVGGFTVAEGGRDVAVVSSLDNLLKGAASQALQNLNLACGFDELEGLRA